MLDEDPEPPVTPIDFAQPACRHGESMVYSGWRGSGFGLNACNLCACNRGKLTCQNRVCNGECERSVQGREPREARVAVHTPHTYADSESPVD